MNQQEMIQKFDVATSAASVRVEAVFVQLKAAIEAAGGQTTPEQDAEIDAIVARLESLGKNPSDPIPAEIV